MIQKRKQLCDFASPNYNEENVKQGNKKVQQYLKIKYKKYRKKLKKNQNYSSAKQEKNSLYIKTLKGLKELFR